MNGEIDVGSFLFGLDHLCHALVAMRICKRRPHTMAQKMAEIDFNLGAKVLERAKIYVLPLRF